LGGDDEESVQKVYRNAMRAGVGGAPYPAHTHPHTQSWYWSSPSLNPVWSRGLLG